MSLPPESRLVPPRQTSDGSPNLVARNFALLLRAGRMTLVFLPMRGLLSLIASVLLFALVLVLFERIVAPRLEERSSWISPDWVTENAIIGQNNRLKIQSFEQWPVWASRGFHPTYEKQSGKRILVMGDSYVWGDGYPNMNEIWWRQLQRVLRERGYGDVEVIGAGVNGAPTALELFWARDLNLISAYKPDLIIWGYITNDPDEGVIKPLYPGMLPAEKSFQLLHGLVAGLFPKLDATVQALRDRKRSYLLSGDANGYMQAEWEVRLLEGPNFATYCKTVAALGALQASCKVPGFVLTLPQFPSHPYFAPKYAKVRPVFEEAGLKFCDILEPYIANRPFDPRPGINPVNGHPGPRTTRFYAERAADILETEYAPCLGTRDSSPRKPLLAVNDWIPYEMNVHPEGSGKWRLEYPASDKLMRRMPLHRPYVQLNLDMPCPISELVLNGPNLAEAEAFISSESSDCGYDTGVLHPLGKRIGPSCSWKMEGRDFARRVNTIRVIARISGPDRGLSLQAVPDGPAEIPTLDTRPWRTWAEEDAVVTRDHATRQRATPEKPVWSSPAYPSHREKAKGKRLLVIGGNYTTGPGLTNINSVWWRQLERELARRGYEDVEVVAVGLGGAPTHVQLGWARDLQIIHKYRPDLVFWEYTVSNADEGLINLQGLDYKNWLLKLVEGPNLDAFARTVRSLGDFQAASGVPGLVLGLADFPDAKFWKERFGKIKPLFDEAKVPFHDTSVNIAGFYPTYLAGYSFWRLHPANGQAGPFGHHFFAVQAADILEKDYPACLGQKTAKPRSERPVFNDWFPSQIALSAAGAEEWTFEYPAAEESMANLPLGRPHVQLCLAAPARLQEIKLSGPGLESAAAFVTTEHSDLHFDTGANGPLGNRVGSKVVWSVPDGIDSPKVSTIRIAASVVGKDRHLTVRLVPSGK